MKRKSLEELHAMAMLLGDGWEYDQTDHTFWSPKGGGISDIIDPDTMEPFAYDTATQWFDRVRLVKTGKIGHYDEEVHRGLRDC